MKEQMPQEIEVWDILPAIRREFAKIMLKDYKLSQKKIATLLHITEPAVSQYLKSKRAKQLVFSRKVLKEVEKSAGNIIEEKKGVLEETQRICKLTEVKMMVCGIHMKSGQVPKDCCICLK
ncbi:MAG: transcriptional regulator [Candidatus Woesearchaeota archaeon]